MTPDKVLTVSPGDSIPIASSSVVGRVLVPDIFKALGTHEKNNGEAILKLINKNLALSVHDISAGGLILSLAEMSIASNYGIKIQKPKKLLNLIEYFFGEDQGRYLIEIDKNDHEKIMNLLKEDNIYNEVVGIVQKDSFELIDEFKISTKKLSEVNNKWYNNY